MTELSKKTSRFGPDVQLVTLLVLFYGCTLLLLPTHGGDLLFWAKWSSDILKNGLVSVYRTYVSPKTGQSLGFMYGPVFMYLMYLFGKWQGSVYNIYLNIHQVKALYLVFDMIGIWYALRFVREPARRPFYAFLLLFNIGLLYNTVEWGQTDGMIACFILVALYYAMREKIVVSGIVFVMTLLIKPQPIIFLPLLGLLWLSTCLKRPIQYTLKSSLLVLIGVVIMVSPFLIAGTFGSYVAMLLESTDNYPVVTVNASNFWTILLSGNTDVIPDKVVRLGLSYRQWGLLFFSVSYLVILFPLLREFYQMLTGKREGFSTSTVLLTSGLIPIVFYFFNTQMHERYANFSVLLLGAYALSTKDFASYFVVSVANFWVMNHFLKVVNIGWLDTIPMGVAALLFFFGLSWGVVQQYKHIVLPYLKTRTVSMNQA